MTEYIESDSIALEEAQAIGIASGKKIRALINCSNGLVLNTVKPDM